MCLRKPRTLFRFSASTPKQEPIRKISRRKRTIHTKFQEHSSSWSLPLFPLPFKIFVRGLMLMFARYPWEFKKILCYLTSTLEVGAPCQILIF